MNGSKKLWRSLSMALVMLLAVATSASAQGAPTTVKAPKFTNDTTPTFEWSGATDPSPSSGIGGYKVEIWKSDGSAKVRGPYAVAHGTDPHTWTLPDADALAGNGADDGEYQIRVCTCDAVGNASTDFGSCTFLLDTQPPVLSNGRPTGWGGSVQAIQVDFTDACAGLDKSKTEVKQAYNGLSWDVDASRIGGIPSYNDGDKQITIGKYMTGWYCDGEWTFTMVAYDRAGNKSNELVWKLNVDVTPPTAPGEPAAGNVRDDSKWYINTLRPTFGWAASKDPEALNDHTPGSGLRDYWFQFGAGKPDNQTDDWASALTNQAGILPTPEVGTQQLTPLADLPLVAGVEYSARVKAYDNLGNCTAWVDPLIIYDPDPPTLPGAPTTTTPTTDKTPVWRWAGSRDAISGIDLYHIQIRREGSAAWDVFDTFLDIPDALAPGEQAWEQSLQLVDGKYEMRVRAMDVAGNYSAWSGVGKVTVDATPPAAPAIKPILKGYNIPSVTLEWDKVTDRGNAVSYVLQWAKDARFSGFHDQTIDATQEAQYVFSFTDTEHPESKGEGEYWFRVKTISTVNGSTTPQETKESGWSAIVSTIYDVTGPAAPVLALRSKSPTNQSTQEWTWTRPIDAVNYDLCWSETDSAPDASTTPSAAGVGSIDLYRTSFANQGAEKTYYMWVRGIDALGNRGPWSNRASVTVDMRGPAVSITSPAAQKNTNLSTFTWTWTGDDGEHGSGVQGYWVKLNDEAWSWTMQPVFTSSRLRYGANILRVKGVDNAGNEGAATVAHEVILVDAIVFDVRPEPGAYAINEVSTIVFSVAGLYDGVVQVLLGNRPCEDVWRLVTVVRTPELAKFYILLDADVMQPGMLTVTIRIGDVTKSCDYRVLSERTGFGFGRLRP